MARSLKESGLRLRRLPGTSMFYRGKDKQYHDDIELQHHIADEVRSSSSKKHSSSKRTDLLIASWNRLFKIGSSIRRTMTIS